MREDVLSHEEHLRGQVYRELLTETGREPSAKRLEREMKRALALEALEEGAHRHLFGPDLPKMYAELERWRALAANPRNRQNGTLAEALEEKVRRTEERLRLAEGQYQIQARKDMLRAERRMFGKETAKEKLLRLIHKNPYGLHMDPEYLDDREVQRLHERRHEHRGGGNMLI